MIREIRMGGDNSILDGEFTHGLGRLEFFHPEGTFSLTPASQILLQAIADNQALLHGVGIDWGCGIGCLAILAARIGDVEEVYGLDISKNNIDTAKINADKNNVHKKAHFFVSDSFTPFDEEEKRELESLKGKVGFVLANPPSSDWDDGFGYRRMVLDGSKDYLKSGGIVLLNISFQYGKDRLRSLFEGHDNLKYLGLAATTDWVEFDLGRPDLRDCLRNYAREEMHGGFEYSFSFDGERLVNAQTALGVYEERGKSPLSKWQTHIFKYIR